jgi:RNA polymerase sigma-70 factor (ECF subfamily)
MLFGPLLLAAFTTDSPPRERASDTPSDTALVAAAQRGDAGAFAALHTRYYRRIYHLAYLKTGNVADAEDIAGETFVRALAGLRRFRLAPGAASLYPWLHRIAMNLIIDSARQRPPAGVLSLDAPLVSGVRSLLQEGDVGRCAPSPQEIVERREVQQLVRSAIATLPADQGEALVYRFLGDLSAQEMAPLLHRSESAVKSLLHRAVVALRAEIERRLAAIERLEASRETTPLSGKEDILHVGHQSPG